MEPVWLRLWLHFWPYLGASKKAGLVTGTMVEPEEAIHRITTTALALVIGVWGLERQENDPVDHFQRKAGRQALEKQPTSIVQILADLHCLPLPAWMILAIKYPMAF